MLPAPGVYGGMFTLFGQGKKFYDGSGHAVPARNVLYIRRVRAAPFLLYVPDVQVFGGAIGILGVLPTGADCGQSLPFFPSRCVSGIGDPYLEVNWSRLFGTMRPSRYPGARAIPEGLTLALGFGTVFPLGRYDATDVAMHGSSIGNNVWVFAPTAAVTYVTPPWFADGTEISARVYWNNFLENPDTQYRSGAVLNTDFAVTQRFGRMQFGLAGYYEFQLADDRLRGAAVAPDGRRVEILSLGGVLAYDLPEYRSLIKIKALHSVINHNAVNSFGVVVGWATRL